MKFTKQLIACCGALMLGACVKQQEGVYLGYAEAEYVRIAAPVSGTLVKVLLERGEWVAAGAPAFILESDRERAAREEAEARVRQAQAQLDNLRKGKRPDELAALQAQLAQAQAAFELAQADFMRQRELVAKRFVSAARLDEARTAVERTQAQVRELQAQLRVARLGARADEIAGAQQQLQAAHAQLEQVQWTLSQKTRRVPVASRVDDTLYREGEYVPAGSPVVSLLPPANIKARFFVPQAQLGRFQLGQPVSLHCDGCAAPVNARISFIANAPEFTSPLIYSRESRAALVFMIEARPQPEQATILHPGQPLEVRLEKESGHGRR